MKESGAAPSFTRRGAVTTGLGAAAKERAPEADLFMGETADRPLRTAVFVAHGMGQQVPFETMDMVVGGLANAPRRDWEVTAREVSTVRVDEEDLRRVQVTLVRGQGAARQERVVDVYEAYWAPLTEGKVGLKDVTGFLVTGGLNGIKNGLGSFKRWLFGAWVSFPPVRGTLLALTLALTTLASLAVMNLVAAALFAQEFTNVLTPALTADLTFGLLAFLALAGLLGGWIGVASLARRSKAFDKKRRGALSDAGMSAFACALGGATGVLAAGVALAAAHALAPAPGAPMRLLALAGVAGALLVAFLFVVRPMQTGLALLLAALAVACAWMGATLPMRILGVAAALALLWGLVDFARYVRGERRGKLGKEAAGGHHAFVAYAVGSAVLVAALVAVAPVLGGGGAATQALDALPGDDAARASSPLVDALVLLAGVGLLATALPLVRGSWRSALDLLAAALVLGVVLVLLLALLPGAWGRPAAVSILVAWSLVLGISLVVRRLLVQYLGDVAAYVSSHKLDRFAELRSAIKARVKTVADAIYAMRAEDDERFLYDRVLVVGHSLGSVVAYDTLNALLLDDELAKNRATPPKDPKPWEIYRDVSRRTPLLLTFGSPLARTAFVFSTQRSRDLHTRQALASLVQPLISVEATRRKLRWVNVHADADVISSRLTYYDRPDRSNPNHVIDELDEEATTPLAAHVEYWENPRVWRHVVDAAFA